MSLFLGHNDPVHSECRTAARTLGVTVFTVLPVAVLAAVVVMDLGAPGSGLGARIAGGPGWPYAVDGLLLGGLAAVVLARVPAGRFARGLGGLGLFWSADALAQSYINAGLTATHAWPGMTLALWVFNRLGSLLPTAIAVLLLLFPNGRFLTGRWGTGGRIALTVLVCCGLITMTTPAGGPLADGPLPPSVDPDPMTIRALGDIGDALTGAAVATTITSIVFVLISVVVRYRRSRDAEREGMRWLLWSALVAGCVLAVSTLVEIPASGYVLTTTVMVLPGAAMAIALVNPALVPIDDLLARTSVVAVLLVVLGGIDALVLFLTARIFPDSLTQPRVVTAVLVIAVVLYGPLRQRLADWIRHRMVGPRDQAYDAVAGLAASLETTDDVEEQLSVVARAVADAFRIGFVRIEVQTEGGGWQRTTLGVEPREVRRLPIHYRGAEVGRLVLPARGMRSRLSADDERLVGDLVRQAAAAARTSRLAEQVQQSRERLIATREEERRRIRRDLHDGLGPALSGVVFQIDAVRLGLRRDPDLAERQLDAISGHVQTVVSDVRRLVHDLRPPALDDRGLVGALEQLAGGLDLRLTVDAPDLTGVLPAAVEVAAYRIVGEALNNVARHAGTDRVHLRLATGADLTIEVSDDGVGVEPDRQAGVGLVGLRERAAELGGTADVLRGSDGGTVVRARLPTEARDER